MLFHPQINQNDARALNERFGISDEELAAQEAANELSRGNFTRIYANTIYKWKTKGRNFNRFLKNNEADLHDAFRLALDAQALRSAIAVLCGLSGVSIPVASAFMALMRPDNYTIIDVRALHALGVASDDRRRLSHEMKYYISYLNYCCELSQAWNMTLRELDRALWRWSEQNPD